MRVSRVLLLFLLGPLLLPTHVQAQGVNGRARTYISFLQVRDLVLDSISATTVPGNGTQRTLPDGTPANCSDVYCEYYRSGAKANVAPLLQDLELNFWTGITGLRAYAHFRGREPLGDRAIWPRSNKSFEALTAYVEYSRSFYRVQVGRMWQTTALGFYNYDGGSLSFSLPKSLDIDVYGGLSLVRGLNQRHHTELISSVESLEPRQDAYLGGIHARWRPLPSVSTSVTYQWEGTGPADALYSERVAGSARILFRKATVDAELKYDLATKNTNLARLKVSGPLGAGLRGSGEIRKYMPFFELWTIWGAFSPVGFEEATGRLDWMDSTGRMSAHAYGSYRKYQETHADTPLGYDIRDDGWRVAGGGRYAIQDNLTLRGEYRYDVGYGASRSGGDLSLQRFFSGSTYLAVQATAFETFSELRVGSGRVFGGGLQGQTPFESPIGPVKLQAGAMLYKHEQIDRPSLLDLNQVRFHMTLEIPIGKDPGMAGRGDQ